MRNCIFFYNINLIQFGDGIKLVLVCLYRGDFFLFFTDNIWKYAKYLKFSQKPIEVKGG